MTMTALQRKTLTKTLEVLTNDLNVFPAIIHLKSKEVLTDADEEYINAKVSNEEKVNELVTILKTRGTKAYSIFYEYLRNCAGSQHLAKELDNNSRELQSTEQIDKWKKIEDKFHNVECKEETMSSYQGIPKKINILLIGKTGSGKSATGNTIIGSSCFKADCSSQSLTRTIQLEDITEGEINITVIDTPGLFDTAKSDGNEIIQNEELMLEIAKTIINFNTGIHLFLLVCSSMVRFTKEEQETIKVIERILSKDIYSNCVLILTNARAQFGGNTMKSLKEYVKREIETGGKFAKLLAQVKGNVIAVENCFDDDFFKIIHREKLLCFLAQIIKGNEGSVYSNKLFEAAQKRVEKLEEEREKRVAKANELTKMKSLVRYFLTKEYLNTLSEQQLDSICPVLSENIEHIMHQSGVLKLESITKDDVQEYLSCFIEEDSVLITTFKDMKLQELQEHEKMEAIKQMKLIISPLAGNYLQNISKEELEILMKNKDMPSDEIDRYTNAVRKSQINVTTEYIHGYVMELVSENLERRNEEVEKQTAFSKLSTAVKGNMRLFLASAPSNKLKNIKEQIKLAKIPQQTITELSKGLSTKEKELLGDKAIAKEILKQLKEQSKLTEDCKTSTSECFAGSTQVSIKWRGNAKISNVKVGDEVLVCDKNGHLFYDKVYLISHAIEDEIVTFIQLKTFSGKELFISPGHLLPAGSLCRNVSATDISIGDIIFTLQNSEMTSDTVTSITYELCRGAYCPMTMHGTIVVNDVAASCYTTFFPARLAHVLLSPIRFLFGYLPLHLFNGLFPYDAEEGMPILLLRCRNMIITWRSFVRIYNPWEY